MKIMKYKTVKFAIGKDIDGTYWVNFDCVKQRHVMELEDWWYRLYDIPYTNKEKIIKATKSCINHYFVLKDN